MADFGHLEIVKWWLILHKYCILLTVLIFTVDLCTGSMCKIHSKTTKIFEKNKNSDFQLLGVILKAHDA